MKKNGFALVEILVCMAVFSMVIFAVAQLFWVSQEAANLGREKLKASGLALEYQEGLKNLQRNSWDSLVNGRHLLQNVSGDLTLVPTEGAETLGRFSRYLIIETALRDQNGNIVSSGGIQDQSTKKITVNISWEGVHPGQMTYVSYLTRYFENLIWKQTTQAEFDLGEKQYVETTLVEDGEVQLEGGCGDNPKGAFIYDEGFENGWDIHPSAQNDIREVNAETGYVYAGELALEVSSFLGTSTKLRNGQNICTLGFTSLQFYAYNDAAVSQSFMIGGKWEQDFVEVVLPSRSWQYISLPYGDLTGGNEVNFNFIFFKAGSLYQTGTKFYLDQVTLGNGVGGYYQLGTLSSSVLDAGKTSAFNRISFNGDLPVNTVIGFQTAVSNSPAGPWVFYGPGGTTSDQDLYLEGQGSGLWLGANIGRYFRYKALLKSIDGENTPILKDVTINYSP